MQPILSILLLLFLTKWSEGFLVPNPPGEYNVTLTTGTLVDYTRNDTSTATPTPRALMLSVFQPAICASPVPASYMPNQTAYYQGPFLQKQFNISANLTPVLLEARLPVCPDNKNASIPLDDSPILFFSPGYGIPRLLYSVLASAIASEGFIVITVDHPEDTNIITYPDGSIVYGNGPSKPTPEEYTRYVYPRTADISFLVDQLSNATAMAELLPQRGPRQFPIDRIAVLGHSLGGASAIMAAGQEPRLRAAIALDGTLFGSLPPSGLSQPVLYMSEPSSIDPSWLAAWPKLHGQKLWVTVANTTHESFSDASSLLQTVGEKSAALDPLLGAIVPADMVRIIATYTATWLRGAFTGNFGGPLLQGQEPCRFPEVSIVTNSND